MEPDKDDESMKSSPGSDEDIEGEVDEAAEVEAEVTEQEAQEEEDTPTERPSDAFTNLLTAWTTLDEGLIRGI